MSIVCFIIIVAFVMVALGDLSLVTATDLAANWEPEPNNVPYMGDPTQVVMPRHVKPVAYVKPIRRGIFAAPTLPVLVEEVAIPAPKALEVAEISLRQRMFGRPAAVYFV